MSKISLTDVAKVAGVSISTVSKVINGSSNISQATKDKVFDAAEKLNYKPNRAAQLLSSKHKNIGILLPLNPPEIMSMFKKGFQDAADYYEEFGFHFIFEYYANENGINEFDKKIEQISDETDGLIFISGYDSPNIKQIKLPKISLQTEICNSCYSSVTVNENLVGEMAAEFLKICLGETYRQSKIAAIVGDRTFSIHRRNLEGFYHGASQYNMDVSAVLESYDDMTIAYNKTKQLLCEVPDIKGIFVSSYVSPGVCRCLIDENKINSVKVVGVDIFKENIEYLKSGVISALIYQNQIQQAQTAVGFMTNIMKNNSLNLIQHIKIKPELVIRSNLEMYNLMTSKSKNNHYLYEVH